MHRRHHVGSDAVQRKGRSDGLPVAAVGVVDAQEALFAGRHFAAQVVKLQTGTGQGGCAGGGVQAVSLPDHAGPGGSRRGTGGGLEDVELAFGKFKVLAVQDHLSIAGDDRGGLLLLLDGLLLFLDRVAAKGVAGDGIHLICSAASPDVQGGVGSGGAQGIGEAEEDAALAGWGELLHGFDWAIGGIQLGIDQLRDGDGKGDSEGDLQGGGGDRMDGDIGPPLGVEGDVQLLVVIDGDLLAAQAVEGQVEQAEPVAGLSAAGKQLIERCAAQVHEALILNQHPLRTGAGLVGAAFSFEQGEVGRTGGGSARGGGGDLEADSVEGKGGRAGEVGGGRLQPGVEMRYGSPVRAGGAALAGGVGAGGQPGQVGMEFIAAVWFVGAVGVGHHTAAGRDGGEIPQVIEAIVVVIEVEEVMGQFMGQGARPVFAQGAGGFAVAVPGSSLSQLALLVDDGARCIADDHRFGDSLSGDAALVSIGIVAVIGEDLDVGGFPVLALLVNRDLAQRHLAVAPIVEQFGGAAQVVLQLLEVGKIIAGVPFEGERQVEDGERVGGGDRQSLDAAGGDAIHIQAGGGGGGVGVVDRVFLGGGDGEEGDQAIAAVLGAQDGAPPQVAEGIGEEGLTGAVGEEVSAAQLAGGQPVDLGAGGGLAFLEDAHLDAAQAEGGGGCDAAPVEVRAGDGVGGQGNDAGGKRWDRLQAQQDVVTLPEESTGGGIPGKDVWFALRGGAEAARDDAIGSDGWEPLAAAKRRVEGADGTDGGGLGDAQSIGDGDFGLADDIGGAVEGSGGGAAGAG